MSLRSLLLPTLLLLGPASAAAGFPIQGQVLPFREAEVSAPVSSHILELKVKEGDAVKAGQPLALLYGKLEELEMQRAKVLLERREFDAKGAKRLYDSRIIPEAKALESRIDLDLARLQYETAAEQVRLRTIVAPMDGVVVARTHEVGEAVTTAQPLFRILDLSRVLVQCAVDPVTVAVLTPGKKVKVQLLAPAGGRDFEGEVVFVAPCADAEGRIPVRVMVENPGGRIRSGLKAQVLLPEPPGNQRDPGPVSGSH
jgi:RND family efflux transporter MFP subunit